MSQAFRITATGQYDLGTGSPDQQFVSGGLVTIKGFTGSLLIQKQAAVGNVPGFAPNYFNAYYLNDNTNTGYSAGTAVTADGSYAVPASAQIVSLSVTDVGDGSFDVLWTPLEGSLGGGGSSSGGGGAVTVADGADVTLGAIADAAVQGDTSGTVNAHLRGLNKTLGPKSATVTQVSMSTTAAQIVAANTARSGLVIKNIDASIVVYLGTSSGVTSANGYALVAGESITLSTTTNSWYGIAASATPKVSTIET